MLRVASVVAMVFALFVAVGSFVVTACAEETAASQSSGSCERVAEAQPTAPSSAVEVPDYAADAEETADPREAAGFTAWRDYQQSLFEFLSGSSDPRDWALATVVDPSRIDVEFHDRDGSVQYKLLERASRAAPNDVFVQWLVARMAPRSNAPSSIAEVAAQRLRQLEPDNAAAMMDELAAAAKRKDNRAVDATLARMSSSTRFDEHISEMVKAVLDAHTRHPVPDSLVELSRTEQQSFPREAIAFASATSAAVSVGISGYQYLIEACRAHESMANNTPRAADCAAIGRLMAAHGGTIVSNRIGYSALRASHTYTDEDVRAARVDDWVYSNEIKLVTTSLSDPTAESLLAYQNDWLETGSELEAIRRKMLRSGIAATPPDDWVDDVSPFSDKHLRDDAQRMQAQTAK